MADRPHTREGMGSPPARLPADAAYQGMPGAYSEEAARRMLDARATLLPCATLEAMFDAVSSGDAQRAVVPVENCLTGAVPDAYELLIDRGIRASDETRVRIDHVLAAAPGTRLRDIARVLSHPVALAQCRRFFRTHPEIEPVPVFDTAGAVEMVVGDADGRSAALASRRSADLYRAVVLAEGFQDHAENWTRFLMVGPPAHADGRDGPRRAIVSFGLRHVPGALHHALEPLAAHGINLTRIQSRPVHGRPFEYRFIADLTADRPDDLPPALEGLSRAADGLQVLGEYAQRTEPAGAPPTFTSPASPPPGLTCG